VSPISILSSRPEVPRPTTKVAQVHAPSLGRTAPTIRVFPTIHAAARSPLERRELELLDAVPGEQRGSGPPGMFGTAYLGIRAGERECYFWCSGRAELMGRLQASGYRVTSTERRIVYL
jgi:hypothetical protein